MKNKRNILEGGLNFLMAIVLMGMSSCSQSIEAVVSEVKDIEVKSTVMTNSEVDYSRLGENSHIQWRATHLGGLNPRVGKIYLEEMSVITSNGTVKHCKAVVDMNRLIVEDLPEESVIELTEHLKSVDFFDVDQHPTSQFVLTSFIETKGKYNSQINGNLTLLGESNSISFMADIKVSDSEITIQSEDFVIDRSIWGLTYNAKGTLGVPLDYLISDEIGLSIKISVMK